MDIPGSTYYDSEDMLLEHLHAGNGTRAEVGLDGVGKRLALSTQRYSQRELQGGAASNPDTILVYPQSTSKPALVGKPALRGVRSLIIHG